MNIPKNAREIKVSRRTVTQNLAACGLHFLDATIPVAEIVANAVDAAMKIKNGDKMVSVCFRDENGSLVLEVKNSGEPIGAKRKTPEGIGEALRSSLDLGYKAGKVNTKNVDNHLLHMGMKYGFAFLTPEREDFNIETLHDGTWYGIAGPYREDSPVYAYPDNGEYGEGYVTRIRVAVEKEISPEEMESIKKFISEKYSWALMADSNLHIVFDGEELSYVLHGDSDTVIPNSRDEIVKRLYSNDSDKKDDVKIKRLPAKKWIAEVDCPVVKGKVQVLSMEAAPYFGGNNLKGVSVFNRGMRVEYSCGKVVDRRLNYNHDKAKKFCPLNDDRNEYAQLATYINIIPGAGVKLPYSADKKGVDWERGTGKELRLFIDELIGGYYREFIRRRREEKGREAMDKLGQNVFSNSFQYIMEPKIVPEGYKGDLSYCPRLDAIVIPVGDDNAEKIEKYRKALKSGKKRPVYKLGREDFIKEAIEPRQIVQAGSPDWVYQIWTYEYKSIDAPKLTVEHVQSAEKYVRFLCRYYNLERERIHAMLIIGNAEKDVDFAVRDYLDDIAKEGFHITISETLIPING